MRKAKGGGGRSNLLPSSLRIISSCLKTVSTNANSIVKSAGATVASSTVFASDTKKEQVLWAGFDKLEFEASPSRRVLLLGYVNGFQVVDVEDASSFSELVSKRDGPVTFLQMQPIPHKSQTQEGFRESQPLVLTVAADAANCSGSVQSPCVNGYFVDNAATGQPGGIHLSPTVIRFYSLRSDSYVHVLKFRSTVYLIRCSRRIIAVALASQIYCFDALTLENKFSVLSYPLPLGGQETGINVGFGPMALGSRWLAYASNGSVMPNAGRLSPQTPSPGVSPSTSPGSGSLMARYALESSKQLAVGIVTLGDMGYKTLTKYCQELLPDGSSSPVSPNSSWRTGRTAGFMQSNDAEAAGMVVVKDCVSKAVISQFRAHTSPICALCFDPSGTLLVTASFHGNNINIFQIRPAYKQNGSVSPSHDWSTAHVHVYKLYRGLTTAVIQDICFSWHSRWVAIVSSKGTCHVFILSSFHVDGPVMQKFCHEDPVSSSSLQFARSNSACSIRPLPVTLSVVSRIKNCSTGWFGAISNAAASASGSALIPSGALAATFHCSFCRNFESRGPRDTLLEHLLVYSPSGYIVQYELPSAQFGSCGNLGVVSSPQQDEELHVSAVPIQYWNVCRQSSWPERDVSHSAIVFKQMSFVEANGPLDCDDTGQTIASTRKPGKLHGSLYWYLSNAEVNISSGKLPMWQKRQIYFYTLLPGKAGGQVLSGSVGGEVEIENFPVQEVEIKQNDLVPIFEHVQCAHMSWNRRQDSDRRCPNSLSSRAKGLSTEDALDHKADTPYLLGISDAGSSLKEILSAPAETNGESNVALSSVLEISTPTNDYAKCGLPLKHKQDSIGGSSSGSTCTLSEVNGNMNNSSLAFDNCSEMLEGATDADSSCSHCDREKPEDGDCDDLLGGVFPFCEDG